MDSLDIMPAFTNNLSKILLYFIYYLSLQKEGCKSQILHIWMSGIE
jgi:hypothetical protein